MATIWKYMMIPLLLLVIPLVLGETCQPKGGTPTIWIDDAPDCMANGSYCHHFGLDFVCQAPSLNSSCAEGTRVLCSYPIPSTPLQETPATLLKVIAYNVWELRYLYWQSGQRERTCRTVPGLLRLHPDVDVIVFNEVFMGGCFAYEDSTMTLRDILTFHGFTEYTRTVGSIPTVSQPENGGVFIASKWPITRERAHVYKHSERTTADSLAQKGAVYARVQKTVNSVSKTYHIFGTHLQATGRRNASLVRILQSREMYEFHVEQNIPLDEAVIHAGDLNADSINSPEYADEVIGELKATVPPIVGEYQSSYNSGINDISLDAPTEGSWIDYALYSYEHLLPARSTLQVVRPRGEKPFRVCLNALPPSHLYPDEEQCLRSKSITDLADHFAVMGTFDFGDGIWTTTRPPACAVPPGVPSVWLDDAPNCLADAHHCARFGLDYVCSEYFVDPYPPFNTSCTNGTKALCSFPPIPKPLETTPVTHFKVLNYNIWELRYFYYETGQRERTCRIIPEVFRLHPDLDAIIFNEAWMGGCIAGWNLTINGDLMLFREILTSYGFEYYTATIGNPPSKRTFENGGVFIASKWPILKETQTIYNSTVLSSVDTLAQKGAMYAQIQKTVDGIRRIYHVFGTHLQATGREGADDVRRDQASQMHDLMLSLNIPTDEPVIYGGDLNARYGSQLGDDILAILDASQPQKVGELDYTVDRTINDLFAGEGSSSQSWIDYTLYSNAYLLPTTATTRVVRPRAQEPFEACIDRVKVSPGPVYPESRYCRNPKNVTDLADHFAVLGTFNYEYNSCPDERPVLSVWVDDAVGCEADASYCELFGLNYVCTTDIVDPSPVNLCKIGKKALCSFPPRTTPLLTTPANELKVVSYNIWDLRYLYYECGQRQRTCRQLPEIFKMQPDLDVIIFQEAMMGGCFGGFNISDTRSIMSFREIMKEQYGFRYATRTVGTPYTIPQPENGGVFIASKWPILDHYDHVYENSVRQSFDSASSKGVVYAKIRKTVDRNAQVYHIFGTHLQAGKANNGSIIREKQAAEMHGFMLEQGISLDEPVVYAGDLNAGWYEDDGPVILGILEATQPQVINQNYTTDQSINDLYDQPNKSPRWIDYAVYSSVHLQPLNTTTEGFRPRAQEYFELCINDVAIANGPIYPWSDRCEGLRNATDLSNHYAVMSKFVFDSDSLVTVTPGQTTARSRTSTVTPTTQPEATTKPISTECPRQLDELSVWVDDAPDCYADASYCGRFGLIYLCEETFLDNSENATCPVGMRVRCAFPPPTVELTNLPATTLKVIAYNVWEIRYVLMTLGQRERTCRILPELFAMHPDVDVIVFNEVFIGGCFAQDAPLNSLNFREILELYGFPYYTTTVGIPRSDPVKLENGGVFIASRWPIVEESQHVFQDADRASFDNFAAKGVMYARVEKTVGSQTKTYHVFGTHMQSASYNIQETIRVLQAVEIYDFQRSLNLPEGEPVIYAGDLNADRINRPEHAEEVIDALRAGLPEIIGELQTTYDRDNNDVFWDFEDGQLWLDYVLYSVEHELPFRATLAVVRPRALSPFEVCMVAPLPIDEEPVYPESPSCMVPVSVTDLSDHYAVVGVFNYDHSQAVVTTEEPDEVTENSGHCINYSMTMLITATVAILLSSYSM